MNIIYLKKLITSFLEEDSGTVGDLSSYGLEDRDVKGYLMANEEMVLCGSVFFKEVFKLVDKHATFNWHFDEGSTVHPANKICSFKMKAKAALQCERTALNLIQKLSGIATNTKSYVELVRNTKIKLLDTRKTTPGMRYFEKYAVRVGGGSNHRFGLFDAVMIKDNHIKAFGSLEKAVKTVRKNIPITSKIEVEIENWNQLKEAVNLADAIDIIMLDNWDFENSKKAVNFIRSTVNNRVKIEISGNMSRERILQFKDLDIDFISTSSLITRAKWCDISMELE